MRAPDRAVLTRDAPVIAWAVALAVLALGSGLGGGYLLVRDMVWVPDLALRADFLGLGSGLPRAVPSDAVVAVLDAVVPGAVLQKLVLLGSLAAGGVGVTRLLPGRPSLVVRLVAVTVYDWNAFVLERLLMGAWPVLVGYAVLPWALAGALRWRREGRLPASLLVLVPLGCLSASAGLATAFAVLVAARSWRALLLVVAGNAPWVVAGLVHAGTATSDARGASVFALHGEGSVPGPLAALTLGGIWNSDVVPGSRTGVLGWVALVVLVGLAAVGTRRARGCGPLVACWVVGFAVAVLTWAAPSAVGQLAAHVPGAGVVRDGARALALCAPLLAVLVASGAGVVLDHLRGRVALVAAAVAAVLVPVALLPGLALGAGGALRPAHYPASYAAARAAVGDDGDVLVLPLSAYRAPAWNSGRPVLDPTGRYLQPDYVASDVLVVDGVPLAGEDPRVTEAAAALRQPTPAARATALERLGIGVVVTVVTTPGDAPTVAGTTELDTTDLRVVRLGDPRHRHSSVSRVVAVTCGWAAYAGSLVAAVGLAVVRVLRRRRADRVRV